MSGKAIVLAVAVLLVQGCGTVGVKDIEVTSPSGRQLDATSCQKACQLEPTCEFFTHYNNSHMCWLMGKSATLMDQPDPKATSGAKSAEAAAAAGAPLEPLPAVEEIHRSSLEKGQPSSKNAPPTTSLAPVSRTDPLSPEAEAAYDHIMDQATKVADMRVVSNRLRGERKKTTTYWEGRG
eukprot:s4283_g4.t1